MGLTHDSPFEVTRPWGKFVQFTKGEPTTLKILTINAHEAFSLQYHNKREEFWFVISGNGVVDIGENKFEAKTGMRFVIPAGTKHRATGGSDDLQILEISTGEFDEEDIVRLEDRYGRVKNE